MNCLKCGGTGTYKDPATGIDVKCECQIKQEQEPNVKGLEYLKRKQAEEEREREKEGEEAHQNMIHDAPKFSGGDGKSAYVHGAVPEWRKDDCFSVEYLKNAAREKFALEHKPLKGFTQYERTLTSIYLDIQSGKRLNHSYLICAQNGMGKETFANTCIKELHRQGKKVVPYLSLLEIYNLINAENLLLKIHKSYITDINKRENFEDSKDNIQKVQWKVNQESKKVFKSYSIEDFVKRYAKFEFSYYDFLDAEVVFTCLSEPFLQCYEMPALSYILRERSRRGKATVVFGDKGINTYRKDGDSSMYWSDIIADTSYERKSLDKLIYVTCYRDLKKGENSENVKGDQGKEGKDE